MASMKTSPDFPVTSTANPFKYHSVEAARLMESTFAGLPQETLTYQQHDNRDDSSYSDRLSTAMIYKAIGMLSSLETIVHHMGANSAACALASLLRELQDLCIPAEHRQRAAVVPSVPAVVPSVPAVFPSVPAATQKTVRFAPTAALDAPPAPVPANLMAVPRCTTCTEGVPVAGQFILRKVALGEFAMPKRCRVCIDRGARLPPGTPAGYRPLQSSDVRPVRCPATLAPLSEPMLRVGHHPGATWLGGSEATESTELFPVSPHGCRARRRKRQLLRDLPPGASQRDRDAALKPYLLWLSAAQIATRNAARDHTISLRRNRRLAHQSAAASVH